MQCFSFEEAVSELESAGGGKLPRLMILDVNFPDGSGLELLKMVREKRLPVKVILLTANNMETDIVTGLELGADDYVTKPFSLMVLRARVNVQLRKTSDQACGADTCKDAGTSGGSESGDRAGSEGTGAAADAGERGFGSRIRIDGRYDFDFDRMLFMDKDRLVELSKTEQRLLRILVENRGRTLRRSALIDFVWNGDADFVEEHALTVAVKRLRDKLGDSGEKPRYIRTVYGIGYQWAVK